TPDAINCSTNAAPPGPWNGFTAALAALAAVTGALVAAVGAGIAAPGAAVCAVATDDTELSTDWAAVAVRPAFVRPRTKPRRDGDGWRWRATGPRMDVPLKFLGYFAAAAGLAPGPKSVAR